MTRHNDKDKQNRKPGEQAEEVKSIGHILSSGRGITIRKVKPPKGLAMI